MLHLYYAGASQLTTYFDSPELTAKLGHDFTVYAYDFSEYETPLVGQGMLSWILASASTTPNAPAESSQTMVTGRVCKNILGLFSNGIKETLEVKLKLVPVPTSMQKEYVENMERYHSLSQIMPEGFDYPAWSDFLKENPTLGQLAQPTPMPNTPFQHLHRSSTGGYEPFHQMLTRQSPSQESVRNDSSYRQSGTSFISQPSRGSSPALSVSSFRHIPYHHEPRPSSRASIRSERSTHSQQCQPDPHYILEMQEDGPPKKRARITQATRPRNTPLTARNDSLHKTAATASSVWLHRPIAANAASSLADAEFQPRAPTPRPGDRAFGARQPRRMPAPSALRHGSIDAGRPYVSPYDVGAYSDVPADSGDDERDESPDATPRDIPSSPPVVCLTNSPEPSSPTLPILPQLTDSGFVSDVPPSREEDRPRIGSAVLDGNESMTKSEARGAAKEATKRRKQLARMEITPYDQSHKPWQEVNPGPTERLPQTYVPPPRSFTRDPYYKQVAQSIETDVCKARPAVSNNSRPKAPGLSRSQTVQEGYNVNAPLPRQRQPPTDSFPFPPLGQAQPAGKGGSPDSCFSQGSPESDAGTQIYSREATPILPAKQAKTSKSRSLPRSHTWSGTGELMSDAPTPSESAANDPAPPRSGGHAKRKKYIKDKLKSALASGELPDHCHNCGEIETPTWRKPYTRVEFGTPNGIELSSTGIVAFEIIETNPEKGDEPMYRIYKNKITSEEKAANLYETMNLCNPCGLYLVKKGLSRPRCMWEKPSKGSKAARSRRVTSTLGESQSQTDGIASDAIVPPSDATVSGQQQTNGVNPQFNSMISRTQQSLTESTNDKADKDMPPPSNVPKPSSPANEEHTANETDGCVGTSAEAALERAIQSSPAGFRRSQEPSADAGGPDLTPKPTRRLLFPSPRKIGEAKSLDSTSASSAKANARVFQRGHAPVKNPRCELCRDLKKLCDRERPCGRCASRGYTAEQCVPVITLSYQAEFGLSAEPPTAPADASGATGILEGPNEAATAALRAPVDEPVDEEEVDKENCPPPDDGLDDLAYLFETPAAAKTPLKKTTPNKDDAFAEFLTTPTPGSRRRLPLTPRRGADDANQMTTPSRGIFTPRTARAATAAPDTPFTRQLNAMLSDANNSSPSQVFDFSAFPVFDTPARASGAQFSDLFNDDYMSSDMPVSSSPAKNGMLGLGFDLYEDPSTSSVGMWGDANIFSSDAIMVDIENEPKSGADSADATGTTATLKMTVGGITVDFASMIEEVVNNNDHDPENNQAEEVSPDISETQLAPGLT